MILSRKGPWTRPWKAHHVTVSINTTLPTSEFSPMMMTHTGNTSSLQCQEVGRRKGSKEVVVIWTYSVVLVCLVWFESKRFVNEIILIIIKKILIIKGLDHQAQISVWVSNDLIIKVKNPIIECNKIKSINTPKKASHHSLLKIEMRSIGESFECVMGECVIEKV